MTAADALAASPDDDLRLDQIARDLVLANTVRLFPAAGSIEIIDVELSPPQHHRWGSHHRRLTVRCRRDGRPEALKLWLKFRPGIDALFPVLDDYDRRLPVPVFPRPYFAWHAPNSDLAFIATGCAEGGLLRDRLLRLAAYRQSDRLLPVFRSNGSKMRAFHDAFAADEEVSVVAVTARIEQSVRQALQLRAAERDAVLAQLEIAAGSLTADALPAIRTHDDWVLRNIIVARDGADCVIDAGGLHRRPKWRWYDLGLFLLNLDFQLKWAPLTTPRMIGRLWEAFWEGYVGTGGIPDGLAPAQVAHVLYLVRLDWLLGGVVRQPYLDLLTGTGALNARLNRRLRAAMTEGRCTARPWR